MSFKPIVAFMAFVRTFKRLVTFPTENTKGFDFKPTCTSVTIVISYKLIYLVCYRKTIHIPWFGIQTTLTSPTIRLRLCHLIKYLLAIRMCPYMDTLI